MRPTPVLAALCDDGWPVKPPDAARFWLEAVQACRTAASAWPVTGT